MLKNFFKELISLRTMWLFPKLFVVMFFLSSYNNRPRWANNLSLMGSDLVAVFSLTMAAWLLIGINFAAIRASVAVVQNKPISKYKDTSTAKLIKRTPTDDQIAMLKYIVPIAVSSIMITFGLSGIVYGVLQEIGVIESDQSFFNPRD